MSTRLGMRIAAVALVGALYVLACHWLMTRPGESPWNVVGVLTPMLAAVAVGAWRAGLRWLGVLAAALTLALFAQALLGIHVPTRWLYVAQHAGVNLFLALGFGSTLRRGHAPLITILAKRVHTRFTPEMATYTRKCTVAWTLYFVAIAATSLVLYRLASFDAWAVFANILSPISVALMFGGEYLLRYLLHPEFERTTMADAIRSYMHSAAK